MFNRLYRAACRAGKVLFYRDGIGLSDANEKDIPLYYWDARVRYDFTNFGDMLSKEIVERIVGHSISTTFNDSFHAQCGKRKMLALGSIVQAAEDNDVIWGSGVNGKYPNKNDKNAYRFNRLDVRAVRGPRTRQFLLDMGIHCPEIYGDPALLLPKLFPEYQRADNPSRKYIVIPHYLDDHFFINHPAWVSVKNDFNKVINAVLDSEFVVSTSLHGIIVAEAFGIPARYLRLVDEEPMFKYTDYYHGTERFEFKYATTLDEALQMGAEPSAKCDLDSLLKALPLELFSTEI